MVSMPSHGPRPGAVGPGDPGRGRTGGRGGETAAAARVQRFRPTNSGSWSEERKGSGAYR
ncbi:hypothetical protein GCM10022224_001710 [Nonomuraea antimicrobica]|uniref:Uncharacterized protein n=1 Tax=Nonomuraea antimicrobica TaxID=561173 RepID=A0ABP7AXG8_9ACTN